MRVKSLEKALQDFQDAKDDFMLEFYKFIRIELIGNWLVRLFKKVEK